MFVSGWTISVFWCFSTSSDKILQQSWKSYDISHSFSDEFLFIGKILNFLNFYFYLVIGEILNTRKDSSGILMYPL